jgi:hypothetical protein
MLWSLRLSDGSAAVLGRMVDELAEDESLRRRYARDIARVAELAAPGVAPVLAWGGGREVPEDASGPRAPWRLRREIEGETLETHLSEQGPLAPDELCARLAQLCDRLSLLHSQGIVVRDLHPGKVVRDAEGETWLVDVGLARTDILSTRTAASLILEGSPYSAPEMLMRTAVDGRADLYAIGVLAFRGLTGSLPFGDTHALLRPVGPAPAPSTIRPGIPELLDALVVQLLANDPGDRPETAALVAALLRGETSLPERALALLDCQNCGAAMPLGQRICLECGSLAVQYRHASDEVEPGSLRKLVLKKAVEEGDFLQTLRATCAELCEGEVPALNFLIGDARMYSSAEQKAALRLPVTLFNDLDEETALALQQRFASRGITVEVQPLNSIDLSGEIKGMTRGQKIALGLLGGLVTAGTVTGIAVGAPAAAALAVGAGVAAGVGGICFLAFHFSNKHRLKHWGRSLMGLRPGPLALPASDPLVARMSRLIRDEVPTDARQLVSRLALLLQRMVDHRAENLGSDAEIAMVLEPLAALVGLVEMRVEDLVRLEASLAELDEGRLVRALAAGEARGETAEKRRELLDGLDRLRDLEIARARALSGLGEACDLARRSLHLGLQIQDPDAEYERQVRLALRALEDRSL